MEFTILPFCLNIAQGFGKKLLDFCKQKATDSVGEKIIISIIEENTTLKNWYAENGFVHTGIKSLHFSHSHAGIWNMH